MEESSGLAQYLDGAMRRFVGELVRAAPQNPAAGVFFARYARAARRAEARRRKAGEAGVRVPAFLIASITGACNLRCAGCYDRANSARRACAAQAELTAAEWARVFAQAEALGIPVALLAGGEPLLRPDVLRAAAAHPALLFPVFTNGTLLDGARLQLFQKHRNLLPVVSIEGDAAATDARRGGGVHARVLAAMARLKENGLLFGASVTVTAENLAHVTDEAYLAALRAQGCKAVVYVEYVPVSAAQPALDDAGRAQLAARVEALRAQSGMLVLSFPGDEAGAGGCLAAGRGFFHINAHGGAEPCPFSPWSDTSLKTTSLRDALASPLFARLREDGALALPHTGGCALFGRDAYVRALAGAGE